MKSKHNDAAGLSKPPPVVALGCGGTGGHLFPGLAVAAQLLERGCTISLFVSAKDVDQNAIQAVTGMEIVTLPAIGLQNRRLIPFVRALFKSYRICQKQFHLHRPQAALAMGGFTSVPPVLAAKRSGALTFLHESNTIPGRANRWLSRIVDHAFIGFPQAAQGLHIKNVSQTGTPLRQEFQRTSPENCRSALGLDPARPVMLVMGGSQGATAINELVMAALRLVATRAPALQWIHLTGPHDLEKVSRAYSSLNLTSQVHAFSTAMNQMMGAATVAISRAGASSLAEIAAMRLPAFLVPYPSAADNHQFHNARAFVQSGAARLLEQKTATPENFTERLVELLENAATQDRMKEALAQWHSPRAAEEIALAILKGIAARLPQIDTRAARSSSWTEHAFAVA